MEESLIQYKNDYYEKNSIYDFVDAAGGGVGTE